ncbi:MAG TPA: SHOCT domain-containing protein [Chloroflexi bacterium]|nr:SHOCT domain-containing protein [Chloroflexota bacterium]
MGPGLFGGCCGNWGWGGFGWLGLVFNLLIIVAVIWLVVWAIRRLTAAGGAGAIGGRLSSGTSPRDILQARYARGEITREQYREMLRDLEG